MDTRFAEMLPAELRYELMETEAAIGAHIGVRPLGARDIALIRRGDVCAMETGVELGVFYANLLVPPSKEIARHVLAHEVMHAHRNLVKSVWRLVDASGDEKSLPTGIENDLEHLVIIPREIGFFPEACAYWHQEWSSRIDDQLASLVATDRYERMAAKGNTIRLWLTLEQVMPSHNRRSELESAINAAGYGRDATNVIKAYNRAQPNKIALAAMAVRFAGLPIQMFGAARYLPAEHRIERRNLPAG